MFSNRWWCWGDGWWMGTTHCAACVLHCIIHGHCVLQLHCMVHGQPVRLGPGGRQHSPATSLGREVHHLYCNCWCWVVVTIHHSLATRSRALVSYGSTICEAVGVCLYNSTALSCHCFWAHQRGQVGIGGGVARGWQLLQPRQQCSLSLTNLFSVSYNPIALPLLQPNLWIQCDVNPPPSN